MERRFLRLSFSYRRLFRALRRLAHEKCEPFKTDCVSRLTIGMRKSVGVAAITHKNSATHRKAMSVSATDLKNIIPKLTTLNSSVFTKYLKDHWIRYKHRKIGQIATKHKFRRRLMDRVSERCITFPDKDVLVLDSCKTFEPFRVICFDIVLMEHKI